jgi:hypothetical protein
MPLCKPNVVVPPNDILAALHRMGLLVGPEPIIAEQQHKLRTLVGNGICAECGGNEGVDPNQVHPGSCPSDRCCSKCCDAFNPTWAGKRTHEEHDGDDKGGDGKNGRSTRTVLLISPTFLPQGSAAGSIPAELCTAVPLAAVTRGTSVLDPADPGAGLRARVRRERPR